MILFRAEATFAPPKGGGPEGWLPRVVAPKGGGPEGWLPRRVGAQIGLAKIGFGREGELEETSDPASNQQTATNTKTHAQAFVHVQVQAQAQVHVRVRVFVFALACCCCCCCGLWWRRERREETNRSVSQLIPSAASLRTAETEQLYQGKREREREKSGKDPQVSSRDNRPGVCYLGQMSLRPAFFVT